MRIQYGFNTDDTGEKLVPFPGSPGSGQTVDTDDQEATEVPYDNAGSGLSATDVQAALDELAACCASASSGVASGQDQIYPDFVTPINGDFAWINQGGASVTVNDDGGIYLLAPANVGDSLRIRKKAAPSTPYTITAAFLINLALVDFHVAGVCWRQSSDGKLITLAAGTGNTFPNDLSMQCLDYTNPTTFSATNQTLAYPFSHGMIWFRMTDNGTNRIVSWSVDGRNFTQLFSEGRTTFLTADEVGFFVNSLNATWSASATLKSWEQT